MTTAVYSITSQNLGNKQFPFHLQGASSSANLSVFTSAFIKWGVSSSKKSRKAWFWMEAKQCGRCGSGARIKMPGDMVSWEAIQYSPVYCSCSDHSLSKNATRQVSRKRHYKVLTEAMPTLVSVTCQTALTISQRRFPIRDVIEGIFEQVCNIGLKSNKSFTGGSRSTQVENADMKQANIKLSFKVDQKRLLFEGGTCHGSQ